MKVMSITKNLGEAITFKPSQHFTRMRALPCEVIECYTADSVYEHGDSADVILLPGAGSSWPVFWNEVAKYVESLKAFVGIFSIDSYRPVWFEGRTEIRFDALFPLMYAAYKEHAVELDYDCEHIFWSPCCVDVQNHEVTKDIDVLFWGNPALPHYPFRSFALGELTKRSAEHEIRGELVHSTLRLGGSEFSYVWLPYRNNAYWGYNLYSLLERARICVAGSMLIKAPHPKYFENPACGCVSITNDFSDREALGFEHGKNIWITDEDKFAEDLAFLLRNDDLVADMGLQGKQLIAERHTVAIRSNELHGFLEGALST